MKRIEKRVSIDWEYQLVGGHIWLPYPEMTFYINLTFPQFIEITYNLIIQTDQQGTMVVRVMIDGTEYVDLRGHDGVTNYPSIFRTSKVYLEKGNHSIRVDYRVWANAHIYKSDWNAAIFKVSYIE